jgi:hypothetical protein
MGQMRLRRADAAPGLGSVEYFGRTPESVMTDRDCSLEAKAVYAAITLAIAQDRTSSVCPDRFMRTMADLADQLGVDITTARRHVAMLERRGHLVRERVRTISGSPQAIRITAQFRGARTRADLPGCNRADPPEKPSTLARAPGQIYPIDRAGSPDPTLKRESGENPEQQQCGSAADVVAPFSSTQQEDAPGAPGRPDFLGRLALDLADALTLSAQKKAAGSSAKTTPQPATRDSVPDTTNCKPYTDNKSSHAAGKEHKAQT